MTRVLTSAQALEQIANDNPREYSAKGARKLVTGTILTLGTSLSAQFFYADGFNTAIAEWGTDWRSALAKAAFLTATVCKELPLISEGFEYHDLAKQVKAPHAPIYLTADKRITKRPLNAERTTSRVINPYQRIDHAFASGELSFVNGVSAKGQPGFGQEDNQLSLWYTIEDRSESILARGGALHGLSNGEDRELWVLGVRKEDEFYVYDAADAITNDQYDSWEVRKRTPVPSRLVWQPSSSHK